MSDPQLKLVTNDLDADLAEIAAERSTREKADALARSRSAGQTADVLPPSGDMTYDDLSNAERFLAQFGSDIRYLAEAKKWLFWNRTHWQFDQENFVYELATMFVKNLYVEATDAASFRHAARSNNAAGIDNMLKIARNKRTITTDDLDQRPQLFNCQNGTIDLTTGEIREHDRNDFITKISPYSYNPDAPCASIDRRQLEKVATHNNLYATKWHIWFFTYNTADFIDHIESKIMQHAYFVNNQHVCFFNNLSSPFG
jgi:phage/plasmid-associated DNA primase